VRTTYRLPYPVARLLQQRFTAGLEAEGELALDAPPTAGLTLLLLRFEVIGVQTFAAAGTVDLRLAPLAAPDRPVWRALLRQSLKAPLSEDPRLLAERLAQSLVTAADLGGSGFRQALTALG
jgi:hypothetical protein